jgi:hypothetical protein
VPVTRSQYIITATNEGNGQPDEDVVVGDSLTGDSKNCTTLTQVHCALTVTP